jgi:hypothetical protein
VGKTSTFYLHTAANATAGVNPNINITIAPRHCSDVVKVIRSDIELQFLLVTTDRGCESRLTRFN